MSDETKEEVNENEKLTKAQLIEKLVIVEEENDLLKSSGNHDLSWYAKEIERKDRALEEANATIKGWESRRHEPERENQVKLADAAREEELLKRQYDNHQSPHTRFRQYDRPNQRDIYGDTAYPVFDLAVDLQFYSGPVQIPVHYVLEMAESVGMLPVEETKKLREELAFAKAKNEQAALLGTELTSGISVLVNRFYVDLDNIASTSDVADETKSAESENADNNSSESNEDSGQADGTNSDEKSNGISSGTGNANNGDDDIDFQNLLKS